MICCMVLVTVIRLDGWMDVLAISLGKAYINQYPLEHSVPRVPQLTAFEYKVAERKGEKRRTIFYFAELLRPIFPYYFFSW
jgi:hypothetical protein